MKLEGSHDGETGTVTMLYVYFGFECPSPRQNTEPPAEQVLKPRPTIKPLDKFRQKGFWVKSIKINLEFVHILYYYRWEMFAALPQCFSSVCGFALRVG